MKTVVTILNLLSPLARVGVPYARNLRVGVLHAERVAVGLGEPVIAAVLKYGSTAKLADPFVATQNAVSGHVGRGSEKIDTVTFRTLPRFWAIDGCLATGILN